MCDQVTPPCSKCLLPSVDSPPGLLQSGREETQNSVFKLASTRFGHKGTVLAERSGCCWLFRVRPVQTRPELTPEGFRMAGFQAKACAA